MPQTMYLSQTESSKWFLESLFNHLGQPFRLPSHCGVRGLLFFQFSSDVGRKLLERFKSSEAPYTTKVNYRVRTTRGTTQ